MIMQLVKIRHQVLLNHHRFNMSKIDDKLNEVLDIANDVTVEEVKKLYDSARR